MKVTTKLAIGAAVVLLVGAGLQPAQAACPPPGQAIIFAGAYLLSNPNWCGAFGCYEGPPVSANLDGMFWAQTGADEAVGAGIDNGSFTARGGFVKQRSEVFNELYHYPAFISVDDGDSGGVAGTDLNWAGSDLIDGCPSDLGTAPTAQCTCFLFTDQWDGQGYHAIMSAPGTTSLVFSFNETAGFTYNMAPTPRPDVTGSTRDMTTGTVTFNVSVPTPTGGDYRDANCDCGFGFRVFAAVMPEGGMPPSTRSACTERALADTGSTLRYSDPGFIDACRAAGFVWVPAANVDGTAQPTTPFSAGRATAGVSVDCGDPALGYDVYLATSLGASGEGPAGLQLSNVSQSSFQVKCGNYQLAEPNRPQRPEATPGRSGDAPRGRDSNRGNRER